MYDGHRYLNQGIGVEKRFAACQAVAIQLASLMDFDIYSELGRVCCECHKVEKLVGDHANTKHDSVRRR